MLHWVLDPRPAGTSSPSPPRPFCWTLLAGWIFRKPLRRLVTWLRREEIAEAAKARKIAADLYRHQTGHDHPDAPDTKGRCREPYGSC